MVSFALCPLVPNMLLRTSQRRHCPEREGGRAGGRNGSDNFFGCVDHSLHFNERNLYYYVGLGRRLEEY